jgi:hypothetical protein
MKTGKEIKNNEFKNYSVVFGTVNNKNPKTIYINISAWGQPNHDYEINYNRSIRNLNKKVKQMIYDYFNHSNNITFDKDRTIVDLDIRESGIRFGKRSFMSCEITLYSNVEIPINTDEMKNNLNNITNKVIDDVFNKNDVFTFYKKKK